jgi:IclR family transcriptional regulator, acetate operon repressor
VEYAHSANGKVFAAFGRAPATTAGAADATTSGEFQAVRHDGFAQSIDELEYGLAAMAAPVRGARGEVIAALSISGPTLRMTPERIAELHPILTHEARSLSRRLGHRDEGERAA